MPRKKDPALVFTPRAPVVNRDMYISREEQERALVRAASGTKNIVVFGESGCGKTWLYKQLFAQKKIPYISINTANIARRGSLDAIFEDTFARMKRYAEAGEALDARIGINLGIVKFDLGVVERTEKLAEDPFEKCLRLVAKSAKGKKSFIVIENVENLVSDEASAKQLAGLINLVDDESYAGYGTRLLIVGIPDDIQGYLSGTDYGQTLRNRVVEIPEVGRLPPAAAKEFLERGFKRKLGLQIAKQVDIGDIAFCADYIPQHLHELGLEISHASMDGGVIDSSSVLTGTRAWLKNTVNTEYNTIKSRMNSIETRAGRRNQVLYTLGHHRSSDFKVVSIEQELRGHFPSSADVSLNVAQMLAELATKPDPIIRRTARQDAYRFVSPTLKVCIRAMLTLGDQEKVERVSLEDLDDKRLDAAIKKGRSRVPGPSLA